MDPYRFASEALDVGVDALGAELVSLVHARHGEMLWQAGAVWPQHAPNLFPIVGQLTADALRYGGTTYQMTRHGFARRRLFTWLEQTRRGCRLELRDDEQTRALYPFTFRLEIDFALETDALAVTYIVDNPGKQTLPASVGAHPAFRWPLAPSVAKPAHVLEFALPEPAPIRRLADGLLKRETFRSPIAGRTLALDEGLFAADAIVMEAVASRAVRYSAPGAPAIEVAWEGFRDLGLWSKGGGDFLCIEPWYGYASPVGFDGSFETKPGLLLIPPGGSERLTLRIRVSDGRI